MVWQWLLASMLLSMWLCGAICRLIVFDDMWAGHDFLTLATCPKHLRPRWFWVFSSYIGNLPICVLFAGGFITMVIASGG